MITTIFRSCFSIGAANTFEKARLQATYARDTEPPDQKDLNQIIQTLMGQDQETRPQIAFSTIITKMQCSESKNKWNYILKNLIILDVCIDKNCFVEDINQLKISHVENYKDSDKQLNDIKIDTFIHKYFSYIKMKAQLYAKKSSSHNVPRFEKKRFFRQLSTDKMFEELQEQQQFFDQIIDFQQTNNYDNNNVLYEQMNLYSSMYIVILVLLEKMLSLNLEQLNKLKKYYQAFQVNTQYLTSFLRNYNFISGFQDININDLYKDEKKIIDTLDSYIKYLSNNNNINNKYQDAIIIKFDVDTKNEDIQISEQQCNIDLKYGYLKITNNQVNSQSTFCEENQQDSNTKTTKIQYLDSSTKGFNKDFFKNYHNEYSCNFSEASPFEIQENIYSYKYSSILEEYVQRNFQAQIHIKERSENQNNQEEIFKDVNIYNDNIFKEFVNEYSTVGQDFEDKYSKSNNSQKKNNINNSQDSFIVKQLLYSENDDSVKNDS